MTDFADDLTLALEVLRPRARRWSASEADADDLLADVALRAWRFRDRFDPARGTLIGWLTTILRNEAARRVMAPTAALADVRAPSDDHAQRLDVRAAFERLPADQRTSLLASMHHGATEAAAVLGLSVGTVASRTHRATETLRASLAG